MKKTMILIMAVATTIKATAQSVTYNHDSSKQNQITVMETGGGSLTPEFYYWLLHNNYKKTAAEKNKLGFRTLAGINLYNQVDDAEKIDSALTKRAEVEALNVADRQIDLAACRKQQDQRSVGQDEGEHRPYHPYRRHHQRQASVGGTVQYVPVCRESHQGCLYAQCTEKAAVS